MKTNLSRTILGGILACLLALMALASTALPVVATTRSNEPDIASIDAYISTQMQANHIPGVALGHNDQIVHLRGFGSADESGRAVTPQTPFILASVSKSFTALAIMQLVEAGKVELDAPVQRYLPWFRVADPVASARITVRHLLYHTSGIPSSGYACRADDVTISLEQYVRSLATLSLDRSVGSRPDYCSTNYDVLGLIVQTVSGQPYGTYMQQHVFAPLQMHDSFASEPEARRDGLAQGHRWIFGVPTPFDYYTVSNVPAGGLISSVQDLTHYLVAQMNGGRFGSTSVLSSAGIATMHAPAVQREGRTDSYGMGWVNGPLAGVPAIWHDGNLYHFHALLLIEPQTHWGAILLVNANTVIYPALQSLDAGVTRLLAGQTPQDSLSLTTFYLILDGVLVVLSALAVFPLLRLRRWSRKFEQRQQRRPQFIRLGLRLTWDVALPVAILLGVTLLTSVLGATSWSWILIGLPDLGSWLLVISALLLLTAILRAVLAIRMLRRTAAQTSAVTPSPSLT